MILSKNSLSSFYVFLKMMKAIKDRGYNIDVNIKGLFTDEKRNSRDGNFNKNEKEIVNFYSQLGNYKMNHFLFKLREAITERTKKAGLAKASCTTRSAVVVAETRKNSLMVCNNLDYLKNFLVGYDETLPLATRKKNVEVLAYLDNIIDSQAFNYRIFQSATLSGYSCLYVSLQSESNRKYTNNELRLNYTYGKFKLDLYSYQLYCYEQLVQYLDCIDKYTEVKERTKELIFHGANSTTTLHDLLFVPALQAIETENNGLQNKIII